ncbi:MAG: hypothetical protein ACI9Y1_002333 [Lentisphaeria bacterium]|jgi:hypothetical protein
MISTPPLSVGASFFGRPGMSLDRDLSNFHLVAFFGLTYLDGYVARPQVSSVFAQTTESALEMIRVGRGDYTRCTLDTQEMIKQRQWQNELIIYFDDPIEFVPLYSSLNQKRKPYFNGIQDGYKHAFIDEICDGSTSSSITS